MRSLLLLCLPACVIVQRPVEVPPGDGPAVLVGSDALSPPINDLARHPWVALREKGAWERWEVMCCPSEPPLPMGTVEKSGIGPLVDHGGGGGDVRVHGVFEGERAREMIACVRARAPRYPYRHSYVVWPGPNSNTFVDWLLRACSIPVDLPGSNVGKDFRGPFGVSTTSGGTGIQLETPIAGVKIGATEGIELHILTLVIGFDWWPPAILVPLGPGRLGFDDR
jgi:hypothetical protein